MAEYKLTTFDNPWSPFDEYEKWETFDELEKSYFTNNYLARIATTLEDSLGIDEETAIEMAIDEIVRLNVTGTYMKMSEKEAETLKKSRKH